VSPPPLAEPKEEEPTPATELEVVPPPLPPPTEPEEVPAPPPAKPEEVLPPPPEEVKRMKLPRRNGAAARSAPACSGSSLFRCLFFSEDALRGLLQSWKAGRSSQGPTTPWSAADDCDGLCLQGQCLGWVPGEKWSPPIYDDDEDDGVLDVSSFGSDSDSDSDSDGGAPPVATTSA
jgi:hypothetical protein